MLEMESGDLFGLSFYKFTTLPLAPIWQDLQILGATDQP